jgi:hypothetical protein
MGKKIAKVKDRPGLVRINDSYIINTDEKSYQAALQRRRNQQRLGGLEDRMAKLESNVGEILAILKSSK